MGSNQDESHRTEIIKSDQYENQKSCMGHRVMENTYPPEIEIS